MFEKLKNTQINGKIFPVHGQKKLTVSKMFILPKVIITNSMQFINKIPMAFFTEREKQS